MIEDTDSTRVVTPIKHRRNATASPPPSSERGFKFWIVFTSTLLVELLSALDLTAVSTALPTVVEHLHGSDFIWAGGAYTIASTAILPLVGDLAKNFGQKHILVSFIFLFCVGSVICGSAVSMRMLIAGRAIQGLGSGGSTSVTEIIVADMFPLAERGKYQGIAAAVWALACAIGPPVGGALASSGAWRWLFFLNIPLCFIVTIFVCLFLNSHVTNLSIKDKLSQLDYLGNGIIILSTVLVLLALTWGGQRFPWVSPQVLIPLIAGGIGIIAFFVLERVWLIGKTVPMLLYTSRTTLSGYLGTFFHGVVSLTAIYYLPVYLQASKNASPLHSGIYMFGLSFTIPTFAALTGVGVEIFRKYRPQNYIGWVFTIVGFGLFTKLTPNSHIGWYIGFQIPLGIGLGILWISTQFPVLAPLPDSNDAYALAFYVFVRNLAQSWGVVTGGAILQGMLQEKLPPSYLATLPKRQEFAYSIIPTIRHLPEPLRSQVRNAFADGTRRIWLVMVGLSGAGLLTCLLMGEEEMKTSTDKTRAFEEDGKTEVMELEEGTNRRSVQR